MTYTEEYFKDKLRSRDIASMIIIAFVTFFFGVAYLGNFGVVLTAGVIVISILTFYKKWKKQV